MKKRDWYRFLFLIWGLWNINMAIVVLIFYQELFPVLDMSLPSSPIWLQLFAWLVLIMGAGYLIMRRDLNKNHLLIMLGILGRFVSFSYFSWYFFSGQSNWMLLLMGIVDLVLALLAIEFLIYSRKKGNI